MSYKTKSVVVWQMDTDVSEKTAVVVVTVEVLYSSILLLCG
jgi:hypothetical protein